jgi:hypothetical protein
MTECASGEDDLAPVKLVECGLEELLTALLMRQPIATFSEGEQFTLVNDNARRILSYYARNRQLWTRAKAVQANEIEELLRALGDELPTKGKKADAAALARKCLWRLIRLEAHRFAGLHRHCGASGEDPEDFVLEIERDVTLISGFNGAGKTALQNVIICLKAGRRGNAAATGKRSRLTQVHCSERVALCFHNPELARCLEAGWQRR